MPIGAVVTNSEQQQVFEAAVTDLMQCFPADWFFGQGFPTLFLTYEERTAFPAFVSTVTSTLMPVSYAKSSVVMAA